MNATIIACRTIEDELNFVLKEARLDFPIIYAEAGLHSHPEKLKNFVQDTINEIDNVDYILLGYGLCGNGLIGLSSKNATLILPQYDDCVAIFLGSRERYRANLGSEMGAFFLTQGMMRYFNPRKEFYDDIVLKVGTKKAQLYCKIIFENYKSFAMVETGAYDAEALFVEIENQAKFFDFKTHRISGTLEVLRKLVTGQWGENFQVVPPGKEIEMWDICSESESK